VLTAGQRVVVNFAAVVDESSQCRVTAVAPGEVDQYLAWQSTQLMFSDTPLDEVVTAFNRYNRRQLVIGDEGLGRRRITGVFRADNLDGFTRLLQAGVDVQPEAKGDREIVLRLAR
jgi:transmembrane sensor